MENEKPEPPLLARLIEDFWWVMPVILVGGTVVQCQKVNEEYAYDRGREDA